MKAVPLIDLMRTGTMNKLCSYREASDYYGFACTLRNPVMKYLDRLDAALNFSGYKHSYTSNTL